MANQERTRAHPDALANRRFGNLLLRRLTSRPPIVASVVAVFLTVVGCFLVYALVPGARPELVVEDMILEQVSAYCLGAVFLVGLGRYVMTNRAVFLVVSIVALLGFLEETGWGGRVFGYAYPVLAGVEMDGVHDLATIAYDRLGTPALIILIALVVIGAFFIVRWIRRATTSRIDEYCFALLFFGLMATAFLVDAVIDTYIATAIEETLEMSAAFVLAIYVVCAPAKGDANQRTSLS